MKVALEIGSLISVGYDFDKSLQVASDLKFKEIELWVDRKNFWPYTTTSKGLKEGKEKIESYGLSVVSICPVPFSARGWRKFTYQFNLAHPNEARRAKAVRFYQKTIDMAVSFDRPTVLVLPGKVNKPVFMESDYSYRQYYEACVDSLKKVAKYADDSDIEVGLENAVVGNFMDLPGEFELLFEDVGRESLKLFFDTANANVFHSPQVYLRILGKRLVKIIHTQDNFGDYAYHLPIGEGKIDFKSIVSQLKQLGWNGYFVPEIFQAPTKGFPARDMVKGLRKSKEALETLIRS